VTTDTITGVRALKPVQLDALREVASIGAGHAATALSTMTNSTIMVTVPRMSVLRLEDVPSSFLLPDEPVAGVLLRMLGDLSGHTLVVFPRTTSLRLAEVMIGKPAGSLEELGSLERSAIQEAGNILSGAYMNALSDFMGLMLLPSPPTMQVAPSSEILTAEHLHMDSDRNYVLCVESEFVMQETAQRLRAFFLLLPDFASLQVILRAVRLA
jgi:chemotaxis protein CheC